MCVWGGAGRRGGLPLRPARALGQAHFPPSTPNTPRTGGVGGEFPAEDKEPIEADSGALCSARLPCLCQMRPGWRLCPWPTAPWPQPLT